MNSVNVKNFTLPISHFYSHKCECDVDEISDEQLSFILHFLSLVGPKSLDFFFSKPLLHFLFFNDDDDDDEEEEENQENEAYYFSTQNMLTLGEHFTGNISSDVLIDQPTQDKAFSEFLLQLSGRSYDELEDICHDDILAIPTITRFRDTIVSYFSSQYPSISNAQNSAEMKRVPIVMFIHHMFIAFANEFDSDCREYEALEQPLPYTFVSSSNLKLFARHIFLYFSLHCHLLKIVPHDEQYEDVPHFDVFHLDDEDDEEN